MRTTIVEGQRLAEKEAILDFISSCFSATGQTEFYNTKGEQLEAIVSAHKPMLTKYRKFYALLLVSSINEFNKQVIIFNLLKYGGDKYQAETGVIITSGQKWVENELIFQALDSMPPPRAYRTLAMLAKRRVCNSRTRWLMEKFIGSRRNIHLDAVKYGRLMKKAIEHAHIHTEAELFDFLFDNPREFSHKLFQSYMAAKKDPARIYELPYTVAEGFAALHKIPRAEFLEKIKGKMTSGERARLQNTAKREGVEIETDLSRMDLVKLLKFLRVADEFPSDANDIVRKAARRINIPGFIMHGKVRLVLDNSLSATGTNEKKNHPISVGEALSHALMEKCDDYKEVLVNGERKGVLCPVGGSTPLGKAVLTALKDKPTHLIIVSDGYENAPAGLTVQVLNAYSTLGIDTAVYHFNPVFAAETETVRSLGANIPSVGLRDIRSLALPMFLMRAKKDVAGAIADFEQELLGMKKSIDFDTMPNKLLPEVRR